jgi:hypothetical protein
MCSAWDQNAVLASTSPAGAVLEEVAGRFLLEALRLPADASFAFVTGCQMAHTTALAAARHVDLALEHALGPGLRIRRLLDAHHRSEVAFAHRSHHQRIVGTGPVQQSVEHAHRGNSLVLSVLPVARTLQLICASGRRM